MRLVDTLHAHRQLAKAGRVRTRGAGEDELLVLQPGAGEADAEGDEAGTAPVRRQGVLLLPLEGEW